ncbi:MAG: hypothetical protein M1326_09310 [Cyanobacteria bacterium]|nr:hypothetical protein [Cyanobacteriota bacterium]
MKQEQQELAAEPVLKLINNNIKSPKKDYFLYYNSGIFPIMLVVIFFLCIGVMINIGLQIQNMNYNKKILNLNQLISSEKERSDRLNLKISELKSPSRIAGSIYYGEKEETGNGKDEAAAANIESKKNLTQDETANENHINLKKLDIIYSKTADGAVISELESDDSNKPYNGLNFILIVKNIKDVLMVVSEGILTFFIP